MARIKTRQFLLDSCIAFEHLLTRLLPLPPLWVILSHSFHRDTSFSYIDWKPHSQRSWCWTADNTIASNGFCSIVQTEGAFSVILLHPCICRPPQITLRISATVCYSFPHLRGQPLRYFSWASFQPIHYWSLQSRTSTRPIITSFLQTQWKDEYKSLANRVMLSKFLVAFCDMFTFHGVIQCTV